ncbi:hypothetical protein ACI09V_003463 [Cronobacter dublinensis]
MYSKIIIFYYVLQPTLLPHTTSRILFAFTVNPLRISAFVTVVDIEQPPRRWEAGKLGSWEAGKLGSWEAGKLGSWEAGKDAVEGIVTKGQQLIADAKAFPELSITLGHDD